MKQAQRNGRLASRLALIACAMFGFGYALVPLYQVFCELSGLNGKTGRSVKPPAYQAIDTQRLVAVELLASVDAGMPWSFEPELNRIDLHPGKVKQVKFYARNLSAVAISGRAVPSVSPNAGAKFLKKIECFCFTEQRLEAGAGKGMPVRFFIDPGLPKDIKTLTLAYTFFDSSRGGPNGNSTGRPLAAF